MIKKPYINDYTKTKVHGPYGPLDSAGVALYDSALLRQNDGYVYHPTVIIQYGMAHYDIWLLTGNRENQDAFINQCKWLLDNIENRIVFEGWSAKLKLRTPRTGVGWFSCLTQAQGLSLLIRYLLCVPASNSELREQITLHLKQIYNSFAIPIAENGVANYLKSGNIFLEEVGVNPMISILNGCLYGLNALLEYKDYIDPEAQLLLNKVKEGVIEKLPLFDLGYWSKYSLGIRFNIADEYYHNLHIKQLEYLGQALNEEMFLIYAERFKGYLKTAGNRPELTRIMHINLNRIFHVTGFEKLKYSNMEVVLPKCNFS
jgi:hypothetical protein